MAKRKTRQVTKKRQVPVSTYNSDTGGYDTVYVFENYTTTESYTDYSDSRSSSDSGSSYDSGGYSSE